MFPPRVPRATRLDVPSRPRAPPHAFASLRRHIIEFQDSRFLPYRYEGGYGMRPMSFVLASALLTSCALIAGVASALAYTGVWRLEPSTHSPTARVGHTMIVDTQNDRVI